MVATPPTQPPVKLGIAEWSVPMAGPAACQLVAQASLDGLQVDLGLVWSWTERFRTMFHVQPTFVGFLWQLR